MGLCDGDAPTAAQLHHQCDSRVLPEPGNLTGAKQAPTTHPAAALAADGNVSVARPASGLYIKPQGYTLAGLARGYSVGPQPEGSQV